MTTLPRSPLPQRRLFYGRSPHSGNGREHGCPPPIPASGRAAGRTRGGFHADRFHPFHSGLSRGPVRSLVATLTFMAAGFLTVLVQRHLLGRYRIDH
ncbi:hypothetical protein E1J61_19060 [Cupriavidus sp. L7L]|nr:hypothetical protein E1J61_19060 [Cupriavidus sp. L7L]